MKRIKIILLTLFVFILTSVVAAYSEFYYKEFVRFLFNFFQGDIIKFYGKDFHIFPSPYIVFAFGLYSTLLYILLFKQSILKILVNLLIAIALFFVTIIISTYLDSLGKVIECTRCQDGIRSLNYNYIDYDFHFIISLVVGLLPSIGAFIKKQISKRPT